MENLELMGIQEMSTVELNQIDGGDWVDVVACACIGSMCGGPAGALIGAIAAAALSEW